MAIGFLFKDKGPFAFPKGKIFDDQAEYDEALESGWNTGPADAAKAKAEERIKEDITIIDETKEEFPLEVKEKPKPKTRRRKK